MATFLFKTKYPAISNIVNTDLPNFVKDGRKLGVFKKHGGFSDKEARQALQPGSQPTLALRILPSKKWGYYPDVGNEIQLSMIIANQYEEMHRKYNKWRINNPTPPHNMVARASQPMVSTFNMETDVQNQIKHNHIIVAESWKYIIDLARLHIEATICHELVHWGARNALGDDKKRDTMNTKENDAIALGWKDLGHMFVDEAYRGEIDPYTYTNYKGLLIKSNDVGIEGVLGWD